METIETSEEDLPKELKAYQIKKHKEFKRLKSMEKTKTTIDQAISHENIKFRQKTVIDTKEVCKSLHGKN